LNARTTTGMARLLAWGLADLATLLYHGTMALLDLSCSLASDLYASLRQDVLPAARRSYSRNRP